VFAQGREVQKVIEQQIAEAVASSFLVNLGGGKEKAGWGKCLAVMVRSKTPRLAQSILRSFAFIALLGWMVITHKHGLTDPAFWLPFPACTHGGLKGILISMSLFSFKKEKTEIDLSTACTVDSPERGRLKPGKFSK
jgi:hypothetical protein